MFSTDVEFLGNPYFKPKRIRLEISDQEEIKKVIYAINSAIIEGAAENDLDDICFFADLRTKLSDALEEYNNEVEGEDDGTIKED